MGMMLYKDAKPGHERWATMVPDAWVHCAKFDTKEAAESEAIRLTFITTAFDWIRVKRARRPLAAGLRWGIKDRKRGAWRFHHDPTVRDGWSWRIFDAPVKILTFATRDEAEGWLTMYMVATGERGRVVAASINLARREWGP